MTVHALPKTDTNARKHPGGKTPVSLLFRQFTAMIDALSNGDVDQADRALDDLIASYREVSRAVQLVMEHRL